MSLLLANNLRILLRREGIGVPTLAKRAKVPRQTIANWMAGQSPQNLAHLKAVAACFGTTIDELCFGPLSGAKPARIESYLSEINAGVFEVVLRRTKA